MFFLVGLLLLFLIDIIGNVIGGQFINFDGDKSFLFGSQLLGVFIVVVDVLFDVLEQVIIIEGYVIVLMVSFLVDGWIVVVIVVINLVKVVE